MVQKSLTNPFPDKADIAAVGHLRYAAFDSAARGSWFELDEYANLNNSDFPSIHITSGRPVSKLNNVNNVHYETLSQSPQSHLHKTPKGRGCREEKGIKTKGT